MLIKKTEKGYSISTGSKWIPLPDNIKTRTDLNQRYNSAYFKNSGDCLIYATDDHLPAVRFDVQWFNNKFPCALENEGKIFYMDLPPFATDEQITDYLRQRAKTLFNKEAIVVFTQPRPEPPEED